MSLPRVKKHFSLFMVKKSIKKASKPSSSKEKEKMHPKIETIVPIPNYLDPYDCFHLKGDMFFRDKLYDDFIGLVSPRNSYRPVAKMSYNQTYNLWGTHFSSANFKFDSWGIVYDRLMSLGNTNAYELAKIIEMRFLSKSEDGSKIQEPNFILPIESSKNFKSYCNEINQLLKSKKDTFFLLLHYEVQNAECGLVMKQMGFSASLVDLLWADNSTFVDLSLNNEVNDFITIEKERYFEFIKNNINVITAKSHQMELIIKTYEGVITRNLPTGFKKACFDENGNVLGVFALYEFPFEEAFLEKVRKLREKKTFITKRKSDREENLEKLLDFYYSNVDFCQKKTKNEKEDFGDNDSKLIKDLEIVPMKRCGFRPIVC